MAGFSRPKPAEAALAEWIEAACASGPECLGNARDLWAAWRVHAAGLDVEPGTPRTFGNALRKLGYPVCQPNPNRRTRFHEGITPPPQYRLSRMEAARRDALALAALARWAREGNPPSSPMLVRNSERAVSLITQEGAINADA